MLISECESFEFVNVIYLLKIIISIFFVLIPLVIIIKTIRKIIRKFNNKDLVFFLIIKVLVCLIVIMFPFVFNMIFVMLDEKGYDTNYVFCYKNSTKEKIAYYKKNEIEISTLDIIEDNKIDKRMYIGDSRTVGMYFALYGGSGQMVNIQVDNEIWYAKVSMGYNWFINDAIKQIDYYLRSGDDYNVVFLMGANDLYNSRVASYYIDQMNYLANSYPNSQYIMVSVNPINDNLASSHGYTVRNNDVISFNEELLSSIKQGNIHYCDTYKDLIKDYETGDGLHYSAKTYQRLYKLIDNCL